MASGSPWRHRPSQDSQSRQEPATYMEDRSRYNSSQNSPSFSNDDAGYKTYSAGSSQSSKLPSKPISERVDAVVNQSKATQDFSPELVAQITEQVLNSLKMSGINTAQSQPASHPRDNSRSPPASVNSFSQRNAAPSNSMDGTASSREDSQNHYHQNVDGQFERDSRSRKVADSPEIPSSLPKTRGLSQRPPPAPRAPTEDDATTLEKIWQPLFTSDGSPLPRLGEFLRGLALHIIEDYEPKNSLVIPPQKMLRFYEEVKIQSEIYPWKAIFGGKLKHSALSHIYRDLLCEHHFIQSQRDDKPSIPALTPLGLQTWMTAMIQAHPEQEYERFAKAVLNMPISNAENRKERFPKELSRRLFPKKADPEVHWDIEDVLLPYEEIEFTPTASASSSSAKDQTKHTSSSFAAKDKDRDRDRDQEKQYGTPSFIPPPPQAAKVTSTRSVPPPLDRQSRPPPREGSLTDEDDEGIPSKPIERERKPYRAQPGGGKVYEGSDDNELRRVLSDQPRSPTSAHTTSAASGGTYRPMMDGQDEYGDRVSRPRTGSQPYVQTQAPPRRPRSPSAHKSPYTRSEGDMAPSSASYKSSNYMPDNSIDSRLHPNDGGPRRFVDEESARAYPSQQQQPPYPLPSQQQPPAGPHRTSVDEGHRRRAGTASSSTGNNSVGSSGQGYYYTNPPPSSHVHPQAHAYPPPPPATTYSQG